MNRRRFVAGFAALPLLGLLAPRRPETVLRIDKHGNAIFSGTVSARTFNVPELPDRDPGRPGRLWSDRGTLRISGR